MARRKTLLAFTGVLFLLAGCYDAKSPAEVTYTLDRRYDNRPVNEFFTRFGLPSGVFEGNNYPHIYRWDTSQLYIMPPPARLMSCLSPEGNYQIVDTYRGIPETHYCELRIYADGQDNIQKFAVAVDSIGKWSASRCSELFSNP